MTIDPHLVRSLLWETVQHHDTAIRKGILDRRCSGDVRLRRRVETLLEAHDDFTHFLNEPLVGPFGREPTPPSKLLDRPSGGWPIPAGLDEALEARRR